VPDEPGRPELHQSEYVSQRRPDPSAPAAPTLSFAGFLGNSDREGRSRLYLTRKLDYYVEFMQSDVVGVETVPADAKPFVGQEANRVHLARTAQLEFTRTRTARPLDEFDLDAMVRRPAAQPRFRRTVNCPSDRVCPTDFGHTCEGCQRTDDCFTQNIECELTDDNCVTEFCGPDTVGECISALCQPF
jgi:hypothetical protein